MTISITELAYLQWLLGEEKTQQENILRAREYYEGDQDVRLTDRQRQYLGFEKGGKFCLNYCGDVVDSVVERLQIKSFAAPEQAVSEWITKTWMLNRMDAGQRSVHAGAVLDGEHFVIVDWDATSKRIRFYPHPRYTDPSVEGTGFGCKAHYPDGDASQEMEFASKRWTEPMINESGQRQTLQRMTLYYPNRIEKYVMGKGGEWSQLEEPGQQRIGSSAADAVGGRPVWPVPWVDQAGAPLGIPVVHFRNPALRSELWNAFYVQDAVNKTALDLLAAGDTAGFRILFAHGWIPTTDGKTAASDGKNLIKIAPGQIIGSSAADAGLDPIEPTDLSKLEDVLNGWIMRLAQVTGAPVSRFQMTKQIAAEGTLKQQESKLIAKVEDRQVTFGNAWEDCLNVARRMANTFGAAGLDEEAQIESQWNPAAVRDETAELERIALKRGKLQVPLFQVWQEAGYSPEQIDKMLASPEIQNLTFTTYPGAVGG
jgi:hypothetical protein